MTEPQYPTTPTNLIPFLPSEVINLIIAHYVGSYSLRITYAWWDFDSTIRIHNIPPTDSLALVSRTFNNIVKHQLRLAFTGCLKIDHDAAESMQQYQRHGPVLRAVSSDGSSSASSVSSPISSPASSLDSASTHLNWLFDNIHTVQIVGYPPTRARPYVVDVRHWPVLQQIEVVIRVSLLPYMREITTEQHDEEVLKIAGKVAETMKIEGVKGPEEVKVGFLFESCRCGLFCMARKRDGGELEVVHCREEWVGEDLKEVKAVCEPT